MLVGLNYHMQLKSNLKSNLKTDNCNVVGMICFEQAVPRWYLKAMFCF